MLAKCLHVFMVVAVAIFTAGCQPEQKKTRKVTIEGPEKKTEVKIETTEKKVDDHD